MNPTNSHRKTPKRIPRSLGLTQQMHQVHRTNNIDLLTRIRKRIMDIYLQEGMQLNLMPRTLYELATYLHIREEDVMQYLGELGKQFLHGNEHGNMIAALQLLLVRNGLGHTQKVQNQANLLIREQRGKYVPFLSSAANQAIANETSALRATMDLLKLLSPTGPSTQVNVQNNIGGINGVPAEKLITPAEAVMLISSQKGHTTLLDDNAGKQALLSEYGQSGLPEVIATRQLGDSMSGTTPMQELPKRKKHEERNEQLGIIIPGGELS